MANDHDEYQEALKDYEARRSEYQAARSAMFKAEDRMKAALRKVSAPYFQSYDSKGNPLHD